MSGLEEIRKRAAVSAIFESIGEHTNPVAAMGDHDRRVLLARIDSLHALLQEARYQVECAEGLSEDKARADLLARIDFALQGG